MMIEQKAVVLLDGREVSSSSEEWRAECLARKPYVDAILAMLGRSNRMRRDAYYAWIGKTQGAQQEQRVREAVARVWKLEGARMKEEGQ